MTTYAFRIVNVFAETPLAGNPLCVFEDGARPRRRDDAGARAAVQPVGDDVRPAVDAARPRTCASSRRPSRCPSPAIRRSAPRTWCARCASAGDRVTLEMKAGVIPVDARRRRVDAAGQCAEASRAGARRAPSWRRCSGLADGRSRRAPPLWVDTGSRAARDPARVVRRRAPRRAEGRRDAARTAATASARWPTSSRAKATACLARFFFPKHGAVIEDPGHRLRVRQPRRLAARDRRAAAAAADARPGRSGRPALPAGARGRRGSRDPRVRPRDRARPRPNRVLSGPAAEKKPRPEGRGSIQQ